MPTEIAGMLAVIAVAAAIALPFYFPLKWLLTRTRAVALFQTEGVRFIVTRTGFVFYAALVCALLLGFAQMHLNPTTWFGRQMSEWQGRAVWCALLLVFEWLATKALARAGYPCLRQSTR